MGGRRWNKRRRRGSGGNYAQLSGKYNANAAPSLLIQGSYGFKICISFKKEKIESTALLETYHRCPKTRYSTIRFDFIFATYECLHLYLNYMEKEEDE